MTDYACLDAMHGGPVSDGVARYLINVATDLRTFNIYFYKFVGPNLELMSVQYMVVKYAPEDENAHEALAKIRHAFRCAFDLSTRRHYPTLNSINAILDESAFEATGLSKTLSSPGARNGVFRVVAKKKARGEDDMDEYYLAIKVGDKADILYEVNALQTCGDVKFTVLGHGTCSFVHEKDGDKYGYVMNLCGRRLRRSDLTVDAIEQLVEQLFAIHQAKWSHCDVHPRNIVIDDGGTARIIDFDHAKHGTEACLYSGTVATASTRVAEAASQGSDINVSLKDELESLFFSLVLIVSGETVRSNVDGDKWKARTEFWTRYAHAARYADDKLWESVDWNESVSVPSVTECFESAFSLLLLTKTAPNN